MQTLLVLITDAVCASKWRASGSGGEQRGEKCAPLTQLTTPGSTASRTHGRNYKSNSCSYGEQRVIALRPRECPLPGRRLFVNHLCSSSINLTAWSSANPSCSSHQLPPSRLPDTYMSVTQPRDADVTHLMYLYSVPLVACGKCR